MVVIYISCDDAIQFVLNRGNHPDRIPSLVKKISQPGEHGYCNLFLLSRLILSTRQAFDGLGIPKIT